MLLRCVEIVRTMFGLVWFGLICEAIEGVFGTKSGSLFDLCWVCGKTHVACSLVLFTIEMLC